MGVLDLNHVHVHRLASGLTLINLSGSAIPFDDDTIARGQTSSTLIAISPQSVHKTRQTIDYKGVQIIDDSRAFTESQIETLQALNAKADLVLTHDGFLNAIRMQQLYTELDHFVVGTQSFSKHHDKLRTLSARIFRR